MVRDLLQDRIWLRGEVTFTVRDAATGEIVEQQTIRNIITNFTRTAIAKWLIAEAANWGTVSGAVIPPNFIALGTGTGTPAATDTALWTETAGTRKQCAYRDVYNNYYAEYVANYQTSDPTGTFTEAGLLDAAAGGNLWTHVACNVTKAAGQTLTVQWKIYAQVG